MIFSTKFEIMELRKNPELDLEGRRSMFFSIGLAVSMLLVLTAFQWKTDRVIVVMPELEDDESLTFLIEPMATRFEVPKLPKPIKKKMTQPVFITKNDVVKVSKEIKETPVEMDFEPLHDESTSDFVEFVEEMPTPIGGMDAFYKFLSKRIKYPHHEARQRIEGRVFLRFIIDIDGSLTDVEIIKGVSPGIDKEAIRVLSKAPPWNPGRQRYKPVRVRMVLPITFQLN